MSFIHTYFNKIEAGEEIVGRKIRLTYWYVVNHMMENPKYEFRNDLAEHVIDWIEKYCKHSKGKMAGKPFLLELWQKALLSIVFGFVYKGTTKRKHRIALLIIARKNGKSTLSAAVGLYLLVADNEGGPEIYTVATQRDQAKIIWDEMAAMVRKSPILRKLVRTKVSEIVSDFNEGSCKALGRDSKALDGLNVHGALMDEMEAWTDMNMYDVTIDGAAARENWLAFMTSTAGFVRESVYDSLYADAKNQINSYTKGEELDESQIYFVYELDHKSEWKEESKWKKANPGLGTIKNVSELERKVNNAKIESSKINNLVTKDFNIPETAASAWLNLEDIQYRNADGDVVVRDFDIIELRPYYAMGGIDLSITTDLTCATMLFQVPDNPHIYVKQMYWLPEDKLDEHIATDKVPYKIWVDKGLMRTCIGNQIDINDVFEWFVEVSELYDITFFKIGYDSYSASHLVKNLKQQFGEETIKPVAQVFKSLSGPMHSLEADIKAKKVVYGNNPILEWCLTNTEAQRDKQGNMKPNKSKNTFQRIDGTASLLDAYVMLKEYENEYFANI